MAATAKPNSQYRTLANDSTPSTVYDLEDIVEQTNSQWLKDFTWRSVSITDMNTPHIVRQNTEYQSSLN